MANIIEPKVLKGFRDFLPAEEIERRGLIARIENVYKSYGYVPIDTPALEYAEILFGKGGGETEKQVYRFTDSGGRDVALRFDLTVPLARFTAAHYDELSMPFKRYHIAKVWRGENTQRGRYREFTQCDCDSLGEDSALADFEILCMMNDALTAATGGTAVSIHVNHRGLFNRFLDKLNLQEKSAEILRTVDKIKKIGREETKSLLEETAGSGAADKILEYIESAGDRRGTLKALTALAGGDCPESERLQSIYAMLEDAGIADRFVLDPSITRGLDYYTGIVYESFLSELPDIGSVCSGGRYGSLAGLYTRRVISGVGTSIGLDRLIAALAALGRKESRVSYAWLAIAVTDEKSGGVCQRIAAKFRDAGVPCELLNADMKKAGAFYGSVEKRGIPYVVFTNEKAEGLTLRILSERKNIERLTIEEVLNTICG
ncbi:MAG: histidine--tRNA ligase [Spirochaetaceae bacterium]|jgi:histidyl-tRNA synthetase|nr:histidine--tRNA ligase [Spirochaetaceae bacterium]